jgi:hypothetical protein
LNIAGSDGIFDPDGRATAASRACGCATALVRDDEGRDIVASEFSVRTSPEPTPQASLGATPNAAIPRKGDRIEVLAASPAVRGWVFYAGGDEILISFDSGATGRLVRGRDAYRILADEEQDPVN